ncbi:methyltransferase [Petropleomorpha daqingensis]|uniref:SAM-dependent methyltransferase n=1 Tax=Petropleomorpha daqingensis TaxID=2026353 RepID=A0A853CFE0_9ACTN|nr:methyltransferase [Petropleomorpha daqingensis]NYJ06695.1 SAM-dependent methyltransferase [Petropleomorpha daqingensis]
MPEAERPRHGRGLPEVPLSDTTSRPSATDPGYVLDPAWHAERERLTSLTGLYDGTTLRLADQLGLTAGWQCVDVGAGTGTVAQRLADRVGPTGRVLAIDTDTRFLAPLASEVLSVQTHDITTQLLPEGQFDLVHARLLLEHLPGRDQVLRHLASALAPGGWLLIEDFDWATAAVIDPPAPVHQRVTQACGRLLQAHGYDPHYGRRLPRSLRELGLTDVGTHAVAEQVDADPVHGVPQWELLIHQLSPGMLAAGLVTQVDLDAFTDLLHDGRTVVFAPLMVSCWGRQPPVSADDGMR